MGGLQYREKTSKTQRHKAVWVTSYYCGDQVGFPPNDHRGTSTCMYFIIMAIQLTTIEIYFTVGFYDQHRTEWAFTLGVISWHLDFIHRVFRQIRNGGLQNKGRYSVSFPWTWSSESVSDIVTQQYSVYFVKGNSLPSQLDLIEASADILNIQRRRWRN